MGRKGSTKHKWTEDELKLLLAVVKDATPMLEHYQQRGSLHTDWWASVSGMLFQRGGPIVTGKACARQFELFVDELLMDAKEHQSTVVTTEEAGKWEHVAAMVDDYEQSFLESLDERLEHVERGLKYVAQVVDSATQLADLIGCKCCSRCVNFLAHEGNCDAVQQTR